MTDQFSQAMEKDENTVSETYEGWEGATPVYQWKANAFKTTQQN